MPEEIEIGLSIAPLSEEINAALNGEAQKAAAGLGGGPAGGGIGGAVGGPPGLGGGNEAGGEAASAAEKLKAQGEEVLAVQQGLQEQMVANGQSATEALKQTEADRAAAEIDSMNKVGTVKDKSLKDEEQREKKKQNISRASVEAALNGAGQIVGSLEQLAAASGASAKTMKKIAMAEIVVNTARGIMAAYAPPAVYPLNFINAAIIGAIGAVQFAKAASEAFEQGGFPSGPNAMIRVNERGQEAVLNAQAVNRLGFGGVNALNNGISNQRTITNEITFSPTINIGGDAPSNLLQVLRQNKEEFARFFEEDVVKRGFLG